MNIMSKWLGFVKFLFLFQRYATFLFLFFTAIFEALSRPKSIFAFCMHALARRLSKTNTWTVCSWAYKYYLCILIFTLQYIFHFVSHLFWSDRIMWLYLSLDSTFLVIILLHTYFRSETNWEFHWLLCIFTWYSNLFNF